VKANVSVRRIGDEKLGTKVEFEKLELGAIHAARN